MVGDCYLMVIWLLGGNLLVCLVGFGYLFLVYYVVG